MSAFQENFFEHESELEDYEDNETLGNDSELDLELDELDVVPQELEAEEEIGRRSGIPLHPLRTRPQPAARRPPVYRQKPPRVIRRHPRSRFIHEPVTCICPQRTCPQHGTEYIRWVQSALNGVLGLRLAVNGVMGPETRSAVRSFQEREGLPVTGIVGPDIERALIAERGGKSPGSGATEPAKPGMTEPAEPAATPPEPDSAKSAAEFDFEWEVAPLEQRETQRPASGTLQGSVFALARAIPDDPNYRKYVPINYRLNAKKIVGEVAQDLSSRGKSAHFWVELGHAGLVGAEIAAEALPFLASQLIAGLAIAGPILGLVATGLALGAPYYEAGQKIAADWSATGFSRGVVMGAAKRRADLVKDYVGNDYFPPNPVFPRGRSIAIANYKMGLLVGYVNGRVLSQNQHAIFWRDLGHRMGDQSYRGSPKQWKRPEWIDWYVTTAAVFRRDHLI